MVDGWLGIAIQGLDYLCHGHPTRRFLGFTQWNSMVFPSLNSMGSYPSFHHGISSWLISSRSFWLQNLQIMTTRCSFCTVGESRYRFQRWLQIPICCGCIGRSPYVWWVKMVGKNCPMSPMLAREMAEKRSDSAYPKSPQVAGIIIEGLPF